MANLLKIFRLLEITRAQTQYGYALAEIPKSEISDLAQHHYLVTFMAWQLGRVAKKADASINIERILEISLVHDLGELFGGDIAMPYAKANPGARTAAKNFEALNQQYLAGLFEGENGYYSELFTQTMEPKSAEAIIAKIADYFEVTHFKLYVHRLTEKDISMIDNRIQELLSQLPGEATRAALTPVIEIWLKDLQQGKLEEIFEQSKS